MLTLQNLLKPAYRFIHADENGAFEFSDLPTAELLIEAAPLGEQSSGAVLPQSELDQVREQQAY